MYDLSELDNIDLEIKNTIELELKRQRDNIELIASENFVSKAVMSTMGSILTNKYAEGYPGKRYYGGCDKVDIVENLAIERAKKLFNANFANVQPHSGAQANSAVFFAFLNPGDTIMGMSLSHGGHLTHGCPVNMSGKQYNIISYGVKEDTGYIDYDQVEKNAKEYKPKLIIAGASAYSRTIDFERFKKIAKDVGAYFMVDMAHIAGLVATGEHPSPISYADFVTTTTHKTLRGPRGGLILTNDEEYAKAIDKAIFPGTQGGPLMHIIAAKAVCFKEALSDEFKEYSKQIVKNAKSLEKTFLENNIKLVSGGTDNHLLLIDLRGTGISGKELEENLDKINITCNKNSIPFDTERPMITSGIRIGTPAMTTRGMKEEDMKEIANIITLVIEDFENNKKEAKERVEKLVSKYPLY